MQKQSLISIRVSDISSFFSKDIVEQGNGFDSSASNQKNSYYNILTVKIQYLLQQQITEFSTTFQLQIDGQTYGHILVEKVNEVP